METPKMGVFVFKQCAVGEAKKWRYEVRNAKIGRYAVSKGEGCHPSAFPEVYFETRDPCSHYFVFRRAQVPVNA